MKKVGLVIGMLCLLFLDTAAQDTIALPAIPDFDSSLEKELWLQGLKYEDELALFQALHPTSELSSEKWEAFLSKMDSKFQRKGKSIGFIRYAFQNAHKQLFKKYKQHSTFNEMLAEGNFDCVSGTAVLGMILDRYDFDFEIIETDYHVFSLVNFEKGPIILESTLPVGGMITSPTEVQNYLNAYQPEKNAQRNNLNQTIAGQAVDYTDNSTFRVVSLKELAGLQYYNDAIVHFNKQAYGKAVDQLSKAYLLYPSDRIDGLRDLSIDLAYKSYGYDLRK